MCSVIKVKVEVIVCNSQNVIDHNLKVFSKIVKNVVVRCLCSVFQKLIKVIFRNF